MVMSARSGNHENEITLRIVWKVNIKSYEFQRKHNNHTRFWGHAFINIQSRNDPQAPPDHKPDFFQSPTETLQSPYVTAAGNAINLPRMQLINKTI